MSPLNLTPPQSVRWRRVLKITLVADFLLFALLGAMHLGQVFEITKLGVMKGMSLLLLAILGTWAIWRLIRWLQLRRGGSGTEPMTGVREPRPPGGRPPALSAAARPEKLE